MTPRRAKTADIRIIQQLRMLDAATRSRQSKRLQCQRVGAITDRMDRAVEAGVLGPLHQARELAGRDEQDAVSVGGLRGPGIRARWQYAVRVLSEPSMMTFNGPTLSNPPVPSTTSRVWSSQRDGIIALAPSRRS